MPKYLQEYLVDELWEVLEYLFDYTPLLFILVLALAFFHIKKRVNKQKSDFVTAVFAITYIIVLGFLGFFSYASIFFRFHNIGW